MFPLRNVLTNRINADVRCELFAMPDRPYCNTISWKMEHLQ